MELGNKAEKKELNLKEVKIIIIDSSTHGEFLRVMKMRYPMTQQVVGTDTTKVKIDLPNKRAERRIEKARPLAEAEAVMLAAMREEEAKN